MLAYFFLLTLTLTSWAGASNGLVNDSRGESILWPTDSFVQCSNIHRVHGSPTCGSFPSLCLVVSVWLLYRLAPIVGVMGTVFFVDGMEAFSSSSLWYETGYPSAILLVWTGLHHNLEHFGASSSNCQKGFLGLWKKFRGLEYCRQDEGYWLMRSRKIKYRWKKKYTKKRKTKCSIMNVGEAALGNFKTATNNAEKKHHQEENYSWLTLGKSHKQQNI